MRELHKKFNVKDGSENKEFIIHKFKATEGAHVLRCLLSCLADTDIQFKDVFGFTPEALKAYVHKILQTGINNEEIDSNDLEKVQKIIQERVFELLFYVFKLALKSTDKAKTDEVLGYMAYAISVDEINRLNNAENSNNNIDNFVDTTAALLLLCREVIAFNSSNFFLGFQLSDIL